MKYPILIFLFLAGLIANAAKVDSVGVYSQSMNKYIPVKIVLPDKYYETRSLPNFATMYLLHGYGGDVGSWSRNDTNLKAYSDLYTLIFICPDGGFDSWYIDHAELNSYYETFVSKELVAYFDSAYVFSRQRYICGVSMGGHGALRIGLKNQNIFDAAISISGVVDLQASKIHDQVAERFGSGKNDVSILQELSCFKLIEDFPPQNIEIISTCGTTDYLYPSNKIFALKANKFKSNSKFVSVEGNHDWTTFNVSFEKALELIALLYLK